MGWRLAHLRTMLPVSALLLGLAALTGWLIRGGEGATGATAGVALVVVSYVLSTLVIAWADSVDPQLVLPFGLVTYVMKATVIGAVMVVVLSAGWDGMVPMGLGIAAGVVVWNAAQIWWVRRNVPHGDERPGGSAAADELPGGIAAADPGGEGSETPGGQASNPAG